VVLIYLGHRCPEGSALVPWHSAGTLTLEPGQRFDIPPAGLTIGRGLAATVRLSSSGIGPLHAWLIPSPDGRSVRLEDRGSTNGIQIAGERVTERELGPGDTFSLARYFDFEIQAA
jgi:pSer/pThr/pTyr-binding forkhead associated (FHA) protein